MANVPSMDLRDRFKKLMDHGLCAAAAGKMLLVSPATAVRWGKKVRDGASLEPCPSGPREGSGRIEPFMPFFLELIEQDRDITLAELEAALLAAHDVTASTSGIDALLRATVTHRKKACSPKSDASPRWERRDMTGRGARKSCASNRIGWSFLMRRAPIPK